MTLQLQEPDWIMLETRLLLLLLAYNNLPLPFLPRTITLPVEKLSWIYLPWFPHIPPRLNAI